MERLPRPSRAIVAAILALLVLAGGASAALSAGDDAINGCVGARGVLRVVAAGAACEPGETAIDWSRAGPAGERGQAGAQGPPGNTGPAAAAAGPAAVLDGPLGAQRLVASGTAPPGLDVAAAKPGAKLVDTLSSPEAAKTEVVTRFKAGPISPVDPSYGPVTKVGTMPLPAGRWVVTATLTAAPDSKNPPSWADAGTVRCVLKFGPQGQEILGANATLSTHLARNSTVPAFVELRCVAGFFTAVTDIRLTALRVTKLDAAKLEGAGVTF